MNDKEQSYLPGALTLGIPISMGNFRGLVDRYLRRMDAADAMTIDDLVTMTRVWNTIEFRRLRTSNPDFQRFWGVFFPGYVAEIAERLEAGETKGMALYSPRHDLYFGGKPHQGSQYKVED